MGAEAGAHPDGASSRPAAQAREGAEELSKSSSVEALRDVMCITERAHGIGILDLKNSES